MSRVLLLVLGALVAAGCSSRSIAVIDNHAYQGELSQLAVLAALAPVEVPPDAPPPRPIARGERVLLVQSGTLRPGLVEHPALTGREVVPLAGIGAVAGDLRAVARACGAQHVLVYWGTIQTERIDRITKAVTWLPFAGVIPDETQRMRVALNWVHADLRTPRLAVGESPSRPGEIATSLFNRAARDRAQIEELQGESARGMLARVAGEAAP